MNDLQQLVQSAGLEPYRHYLPDIEINKPHLCPFHADGKTPNLSLYQAEGVYKFKCFACSASGDALDFIKNMEKVELPAAIEKLKELIGTPTNVKIENKSKTPHKEKPARPLTLGQIKKETLRGGYKCQRLHEYGAGTPLYIKAIYKNSSGSKQGRYWSLIDADKGLYQLGRISDPVIYNQELLEQIPDGTVVLVEGEKDCDTLTGYGFLAVTAGSSSDLQSKAGLNLLKEHLKGRNVILTPDKDEVGQQAMQSVAKALSGVVKSLRMIDVGAAWNSLIEGQEVLPKAADISDLIETYQRCFPQSDPEDVRTIINSLFENAAETPNSDADRRPIKKLENFHLTDLGNAKRFATQHDGEVLFVNSWGWLHYDGTRWRKDDTGAILRRAKDTVASIYKMASTADSDGERQELAKHALKSEGEVFIRRMVSLAQSEIEVSATPGRFDGEPLLFNCLNETINLKTGVLLPHSSAHCITKIAPVTFNAGAGCPDWLRFLDVIMQGDSIMIRYLQKFVGYCLTGLTTEQLLHILHGIGANGKSVFINILRELFGEYGMQADADTFMSKRNEGIPNDLARLAGSRFVSVIETESGRRLAESLVKSLSGGDRVVARFLHREYFEYIPQFKIVLVTNHKPIIRGQDYSIWRRLRLIPFNVVIPPEERDPNLTEKLKQELPGILNWAVEGCLLWQKEGLTMPEEVQSATSNYRVDMADNVTLFINDKCVLDPDGCIPAKKFYEVYVTWCDLNGDESVEQRTFKRKLQDMCFKQKRSGENGCRQWHGIRFTDSTDGDTSNTHIFPLCVPYGKNRENDVMPSVASVNDKNVFNQEVEL